MIVNSSDFRQLEERRKKEQDLRKALLHKRTERSQMQEKYLTLQEIAAAKNFETVRLESEIVSLKSDLDELKKVRFFYQLDVQLKYSFLLHRKIPSDWMNHILL